MQKDVDTVATPLTVHLFGVNEAGEESGNTLMCQGRTIPWLQDTPAVHAWSSWQVTQRDLVILDADNKVVRIYNLTVHSLSDSTNYAELRGILIAAASASQPHGVRRPTAW